jgi:hypothetical protein
MLLLVHNIHTALNLNVLNSLENSYSMNTNYLDVNINSTTDPEFANSIRSLYLNNDVPFSF